MSADAVIRIDTELSDINAFITEKLGPAIDGTPFALVNATFLAILIDKQGPPDLTMDELAEGVSGASGWITMWLSELRAPKVEAN